MDRLLEKLRQNMAELSVQGDDFTRQIWHMYATFEEFIDTHTSFGKFGDPPGPGPGHSPCPETPKQPIPNQGPVGAGKGKGRDEVGGGGAPRPRPRPRASNSRRRRGPGSRQVIGGSALELTVPRDMAVPSRQGLVSASAPAAALEFHLEPAASASKLGNSKDDMSLVYRPRPQHHRCRYRRSRRRLDIANPLLETISAIQDPCESDDHDYGDPGPQYYGVREHRLPGSRFCSDADKDSIGYAGSNSIDSGYKSSCPTPEPTDGILLYGNDTGGSKRSSIASQGSQKPRILMGTKVMNRHSHPQYAGRDLDHLMYLRQSILSAMQRYEQQAVSSSPSPGFRPRSSSASSPGYRSASPSPSPGGPGSSPLPQRRPHMASCPSSRTHSPCYSSASNGSGKSSPGFHRSRLATAEEDIDTLLYGRVEEFPCSYVTMIEDKYRRSSVARVKKLREKSRGGLTAPESTSSSDSSCTSPTGPKSQSGRFSEVAKCMLAIIEDLQNQTQLPGSTPVSPPAPAPSSAPPALSSPAPVCGGQESLAASTSFTTPPGLWQEVTSPGLVLRSGPADYHVYEEIMYELTSQPRSEPGPPPLPARPDGIFRSGTGAAVSKKTSPTPQPPQPHRPKQRSNLYSLFREPSARRTISQSLEQEFRGAGLQSPGSTLPTPRRGMHGLLQDAQQQSPLQPPPPTQTEEEEYGFRMPT